MRIDPRIRTTLERVFATHDASELSVLLGFDAHLIPARSLEETVARTGIGIELVCSRGSRGTLICYEVISHKRLERAELGRVARAFRAHNYAQLQLFIIAPRDFSHITIATCGVGEHLLTLTLRSNGLHVADLETLQEMIPGADEKGSALAARYVRTLDRSRVTQRFFVDFAAQRDSVARAWSGIASQARRDREQLALLLLSRLMFLYFLQHRGYLESDERYLVRRLHAWQGRTTFYRGALCPLFFSVLNRRPERRPPRALQFGALPYLNGGLFERHPLERKHKNADLDNAKLRSVFDDLLERYRFTAPESSDAHVEGVQDVGVDPEMLGRVFEGLMASRVRETTGTFYTPAATVDKLVCNALIAHVEQSTGTDAAIALIREGNATQLDGYQRSSTSSLLRETKILDPACGSGAFLLGSLARLARARAALDGEDELCLRRDAVARSLFGVDLQGDAALLCALRLWLALVPGGDHASVQPLPNLDRQIRQGDSLVDPFDLRAAASSAAVRRLVRDLAPAAHAYVTSEPEQRPAIRRTLVAAEQRLAHAWIDAHQRRVNYEAAELAAVSQEVDLFGAATSEARAARALLRTVRQRAAELKRLSHAIRRKDERPFFSFGVHFPEAVVQGFDVVLCNPPWVRSHNWPRTITNVVRQRFQICQGKAWLPPYDGAASPAGGKQTDLALLFLERSIELLAPGGVLGIILPAKFMRSLSGASARKLLLEQTDIVSIEDYSLDQRSIFAADAFASLIIARKRAPQSATPPHSIAVTCIKRHVSPMRFAVTRRELPLFAGDTRAPWLLVPSDVRRALARMQEAPALGAHKGLSIQRGVVTGRNDVLVLATAQPKLSGLTEIRSEGYAHAAMPERYTGVVESIAVRPLLRGSDISAWSARREGFVLCRSTHGGEKFPRLAKYLAAHDMDLAAVPKVAPAATMLMWHDLASTLKAVVVPAGAVALNTVYFIPLDDDLAHLLCGYFNSLPIRTFARAIAERAKDAHFRFFAWTMSLLPLPPHRRVFEAEHIRDISRAAHASNGLDQSAQTELDQLIARSFGLARLELRALASFDEWLRPS